MISDYINGKATSMNRTSVRQLICGASNSMTTAFYYEGKTKFVFTSKQSDNVSNT